MSKLGIAVLGVSVVLLFACGTEFRIPPFSLDSGTAVCAPGAGDAQVLSDVSEQTSPDSGTHPDEAIDGQPGVDSGAQADQGVGWQPDVDSATQADSGSTSAFRMPWTLIALPDTQYYSSTYPQIFDAQTQWIVDNKVERNILYVVHEGDIVDNDVDNQWTNASHSMHLLDLNVPYALAMGNHDYPGAGGAISRDTTLFDTYFSLTSLDWQATFRGTYEPGTAGNSFHSFEVNGETWLILSLEFGPRDAVLAWADGVLKANPSANAIVLTHAYLYSDGTRFDHHTRTDQAFNPHTYGVEALAGGVNDGEEIWQKLIVSNPNVRIVLCGHVHAESHLTSTRDAGPPVHQILADYQDDGQGGDGYLRIMTFQPNGAIDVSSYSPYLKQYRTDAENLFTLSL